MAVIGCLAAIAVAACGAGDDSPRTGEFRSSATDEPAAAAAAAFDKQKSAIACPQGREDRLSAKMAARLCGGRVEVTGELTETTQVWAEPNGTLTADQHIGIKRFRKNGAWVDVDLNLTRQADGSFAAKAHPGDLRLAGAAGDGVHPLVAIGTPENRITLDWTGALPEPELAGAKATYRNVRPGVDLVVQSMRTGFEHLLVVHNRQALRHVASIKMGLTGPASESDGDGGLVYKDKAGKVVGRTPAPQMWDAEVDPVSKEPTAIKKVALGVSKPQAGAPQLALTPDAVWLNNPARKFPITIDPFVVQTTSFDTYVNSSVTDDLSTWDKLALGTTNSGATKRIAYVNFSAQGLSNAKINWATLKLWGQRSDGSCASGTWQIWRTQTNAYSGTRWSNRPGLAEFMGNSIAPANGVCTGQWMEGDATALFQYAANAGWWEFTVAMVPYWDDTNIYYKEFKSSETGTLPHVTLNWDTNTKPSTPDMLTVDNKPCASGPNRPFVKTTTPTLRAHVTDPDGDAMNVWFAWAKWNGSSFVDEPGGGMQGSVPSGTTAVFNVTGNVDGGIYTFRSQSDDSPSHSPYLVSDVTNIPGNCEWQVDISPPAVPTVTADVYQEGRTSGSVGQTGRFTLSSSPDTKSFLWGWSDPPTSPLTPSTLGGSVSIDWTPTSSGARTLFVRAIDRAENESNKAYQFIVAPESTALARWLLNDVAGATQLADDTGNGNTLTVTDGVFGAPGRIVPGADGLSRSAMQFDGVDDVATTSGPVLADTSKSFSVAAWVKLADTTASHRALEQVGTAGGSAFALEYDQPTNTWKFTAPAADGSAFPGATSSSTPRLTTWTHLVGTYDSAAKTLKLYVNGTLEKTATGITTWAANGALRIGASWAGAVSEVQVWNRVISDTEVFNLSDPIQVGKVGDWHMDQIGFGPAIDSSDLAHDLTFYNGASIPASGAGHTGTGLRLDGVDDYAAPDGQVLHTDQSFTVSVWARPTTIAVDQVFVSQQSDGGLDGFALYFGNENGGVWKFRKYTSSTDSTNTTFAVAPAVDVTANFRHLVGVFDAQKREMRLYVDGVLLATSPMNAAWQPWDATGPLLIGRDQDFTTPGKNNFTNGDLDEVRVYQGVVADVTRIP
jgi:hypothetical protein